MRFFGGAGFESAGRDVVGFAVAGFVPCFGVVSDGLEVAPPFGVPAWVGAVVRESA